MIWEVICIDTEITDINWVYPILIIVPAKKYNLNSRRNDSLIYLELIPSELIVGREGLHKV